MNLSVPEVGGLLSFLLLIAFALIGVIYRNDQKSYETTKTNFERKIEALEKQNLEQETKIATIQANANNHYSSVERLADTVERLDGKVDDWSRSMTSAISQLASIAQQISSKQQYERRVTPPPIPRVDK